MYIEPTNYEEVVDQLKTKIKKYEDVIENILDEEKPIIGIIKSSPFVENGKTYYRCEVDSKDILAIFSKTIMFDKSDIEIGKEVVLIKGAIIGVVPKELEPPKEKNTFPLIGWNEIGGLKSQLHRIKESIQLPLLNSKLTKEFGLQPIKGMLLYGPPGCGKTLIAKAIASDVLKTTKGDDESFYYLKGGELLTKYVGETESRIVTMFKQTRNYSMKTGNRAVIFIDEAEAILPARGSRMSSDVETTIVPTFLSEMDGFDDNSPFVLLSTNHPHQIDDAVMREGRIDVKIEVSRPTKCDAVEITKIHLSKVKIADGDVNTLAELCVDKLFESKAATRVSGAMLKTVVNMSTQKALSRFVNGDKKNKGVIKEDIYYSIENL